ncbi:MAG: MBL fold metallo-hydrolase [Candidatus Aureabacteria bacterium]|nr:MBL fold metallo-hydrolase [Candidatus Auribacterota bacterium]
MKKEIKIFLLFSFSCFLIFLFSFFISYPLGNVLLPHTDFKPSGLMEIHFLDVNQGNSTLIILPDGKAIVYDGGKRGNRYSPFDAGKKKVVPFLKKRGIKVIFAVICSSPDDDHCGGLPELYKNFKVLNTYDIGLPHTTESYASFLKAVEKEHGKYILIREGMLIEADESVLIQCLWPPEPLIKGKNGSNNNSAVLKITYGDTSVLLPGDIEKPAEKKLLKYAGGLKCSVLLAAHHGSKTSNSETFLKFCSPDITVISCGKNNPFGHPDAEVLKRLESNSKKLFRTDINGDISIFSNGTEIEIFTEK